MGVVVAVVVNVKDDLSYYCLVGSSTIIQWIQTLVLPK